MKQDRQSAILRMIAQNEIMTQEELAARLIQDGYPVTQATVSRDIRDLRLIKVVGDSGRAHYAVKPSAQETEDLNASRFSAVLQEGFVSAVCAGNLLIVKTVTGMAMAVAASLDSLEIHEIVGSIAGDDTIFLAMQTHADCQRVKEHLDRIIQA